MRVGGIMSSEDKFLAAVKPEAKAANLSAADEAEAIAEGLTAPDNQRILKDAETKFIMGDLAGAEPLYRQLLKTASRHPGLHLRLGEICYRQNRLSEAAEYLEVAAAQRPRDRHLYNTLGYTHLRLGEPDQAKTFFSRALGVDQDYFEAWMGLGISDRTIGQMRPAMHAFERAVALRPQSAEAWNDLGVACNAMQMPIEARTAFDRAIAADPTFARAYAGRASTLMMLGFREAAEEAIREAVTRAPEDVQIFRLLTTIRRFEPEDADLARMDKLAQGNPALSGADRMALDFALAKAFDDCGDAPRAFRHMQRANTAKRSMLSYDEAAHLGEMEKCAALFPQPFSGGQTGFHTDVPVFIVGMPRSGSSLLEHMLASHPEIAGIGERPDFGVCAAGGYAPGLAAKLPVNPARVGEAYLARIRQIAPRSRRIIDKRLDNFRFLGTIHSCLPDAHIIYIHRDAMDCCLSTYLNLFNGPVDYAYDPGELGRYYRGAERLMAHWRSVLPENVLLEVRYEDLVRDTEGVLRQILGFIGMEWNAACRHYITNAHPVMTASAAGVRSPVYQRAVGRAAAYAPWLGPLLIALTEDMDADKAGKLPERHAGGGDPLATGTTS